MHHSVLDPKMLNTTLKKLTPKRRESPGASVFVKDQDGQIYHTYSTYGRGLDLLIGTYNYIDLTPKGRDEGQLPWPMAWVKHNDRYPEN